MSQKDVDAGEQCMTCGASIFSLRPPGYRQECTGCKSLSVSAGEVVHDSRLRCPKCSKSWEAYSGDEWRLLEEGEHEVTCPECDHEFEIVTYVTHSYKSPARAKDEVAS